MVTVVAFSNIGKDQSINIRTVRNSKAFLYLVPIVSLFYLIPSGQMVYAEQQRAKATGNLEQCFLNYGCSRPWWILSFILLLTIEADDLLASCNTHISSKTFCYRRHLSPTDPNDSVPDTPTSPGDVHLATRLTQHMLSKQRTWFCPFCSGQPYHHQHLQDHLLQNHSEELSQVKNEIYSKFKPEKCPCCEAEFLKPGLGAKQTQLLALNLVQQNS